MVKRSVIYQGRPVDPAAFDASYRSKHLPTVARWPAVRRIVVAGGQAGDEWSEVCDIVFESRAALETALASPERQASAEDVKRFPALDGQIKRQVFDVRAFHAA
jgi:uncharacterized protein (TIGR02118 family)